MSAALPGRVDRIGKRAPLRLAASSACHSVISGSAIRVGLMAAPSSRACVRQGGPYLMPRALWGPSPSVSWLSRPPSVSRDKVASAFALILKDPDLTDQAGASKLGRRPRASPGPPSSVTPPVWRYGGGPPNAASASRSRIDRSGAAPGAARPQRWAGELISCCDQAPALPDREEAP